MIDTAKSTMKRTISCLAAISAGLAFAQAQQTNTQTATPNVTPPRARFANSNDAFYSLGPDSKPREGVPRGKYIGPKIIPSTVFPGTQHTYWIYVPAQYDPAQPAALMIFNDGQAMMAEPGDV